MKIKEQGLCLFFDHCKGSSAPSEWVIKWASVDPAFNFREQLEAYQAIRPPSEYFSCREDGSPLRSKDVGDYLDLCLMHTDWWHLNVTSHSFRVGQATERFQAEDNIQNIQRMGRWTERSNAFETYLRPGSAALDPQEFAELFPGNVWQWTEKHLSWLKDHVTRPTKEGEAHPHMQQLTELFQAEPTHFPMQGAIAEHCMLRQRKASKKYLVTAQSKQLKAAQQVKASLRVQHQIQTYLQPAIQMPPQKMLPVEEEDHPCLVCSARAAEHKELKAALGEKTARVQQLEQELSHAHSKLRQVVRAKDVLEAKLDNCLSVSKLSSSPARSPAPLDIATPITVGGGVRCPRGSADRFGWRVGLRGHGKPVPGADLFSSAGTSSSLDTDMEVDEQRQPRRAPKRRAARLQSSSDSESKEESPSPSGASTRDKLVEDSSRMLARISDEIHRPKYSWKSVRSSADAVFDKYWQKVRKADGEAARKSMLQEREKVRYFLCHRLDPVFREWRLYSNSTTRWRWDKPPPKASISDVIKIQVNAAYYKCVTEGIAALPEERAEPLTRAEGRTVLDRLHLEGFHVNPKFYPQAPPPEVVTEVTCLGRGNREKGLHEAFNSLPTKRCRYSSSSSDSD